MEINPRLYKLIDYRLKSSLGDNIFLPHGQDIWVIDSKTREWIFNINCEGNLRYNFKYFNFVFLVFSMEWNEYQKILKIWVEKLFKIPVRKIERVGGDMRYQVEYVLKNNKKWDLKNRYTFSYFVVKEYLTKNDIYEEVKLEHYFQ